MRLKNLLQKFAATLKKFSAQGAKKVEYGIYIHFNQNLDKKSYMSALIEAVNNLHWFLLLTSKQRQWGRDIANVQSDCIEPCLFWHQWLCVTLCGY